MLLQSSSGRRFPAAPQSAERAAGSAAARSNSGWRVAARSGAPRVLEPDAPRPGRRSWLAREAPLPRERGRSRGRFAAHIVWVHGLRWPTP